MIRYVALLRAVNVGGTGKLVMDELKALCAGCGFADPRTYIASGNVVFADGRPEAEVKTALEAALHAHTGARIGVLVRTDEEMARVLAHNPFPDVAPSQVGVIFLDGPSPADVLEAVVGRADEQFGLGARELYVAYPSGMGRSKLRIPAARDGTSRNINTVRRLAEMAAGAD